MSSMSSIGPPYMLCGLQAIPVWTHLTRRANTHPAELPAQPQGQHNLRVKGRLSIYHSGAFNSLPPRKVDSYFEIFLSTGTSWWLTVLRTLPFPVDEKPTLYQAIAWCHFALDLPLHTVLQGHSELTVTKQIVCSTSQPAVWHASECDTPTQMWRIQISTGNTLPLPTWCKQKAFPFPGTGALWVFWKRREFPAFFRGCGQSYARWDGVWNSL